MSLPLNPELKLLREQIINDVTKLVDDKLLQYQKLHSPSEVSSPDFDSLDSDNETDKNTFLDRFNKVFEKGFGN